MPYPERKRMTTYVIVVATEDVRHIRAWLRQAIVENEGSEPVKEFLFEAYQKLGER